MLSKLGREGCLERAWRAWAGSGSALATPPPSQMGRVAGDPGAEQRANSLKEFASFLSQNGLEVANLDFPASEGDLPSHREDTSEPRESRSAIWKPFYKRKRNNSPRELMPLSTA